MGWWQTAGNAQQFFNATLPHIIKTIETLSENIGRLAMATEKSNELKDEKIGIGGDLKYLRELVEGYGSQTKLVDVIKKEKKRVLGAAKGAQK
jgi:hypothetical protein